MRSMAICFSGGQVSQESSGPLRDRTSSNHWKSPYKEVEIAEMGTRQGLWCQRTEALGPGGWSLPITKVTRLVDYATFLSFTPFKAGIVTNVVSQEL